MKQVVEAVCLLLCMVAVHTAPSVRPNTSGLPKQSCVGGHRHASTVNFGDFWYYCNDGALENRGCFAQNRRKIAIGQTHIADGVKSKCTQNSKGELLLRHLGCIVDTKLHRVNELWNNVNGTLWFFCEAQGDNKLQLVFGGCVMNGERIGKNAMRIRKGVVYKCLDEQIAQDGDAGIKRGLTPIGCMSFAKQYTPGESFQDNKFWYTCMRLDATTVAKVVHGCIYDGRKLQPGDRYVDGDDVVYTCVVEPTPQHRPTGCADNALLYEIGQAWMQGVVPYKYLMQCLETEGGASTEKVAIACSYQQTADSESKVIDVGCYEIIGDQVIACQKRSEDDMLIYTIFHASQQHFAPAFKVKQC